MKENEVIKWDLDVKILSNKFLVRQFFLIVLIPTFLLFSLLSIISLTEGVDNLRNYFESVAPAFCVGLGFFLSLILIIMLFFRNRYPLTFVLNEKVYLFCTEEIY